MIFMNISLIQWFYKKQPKIETYVFGDEFTPTKNIIEKLHGIRYK